METKKSPHILGTAPIGKLLAEYSIPAIIGMTVTSLYHAIDSIFIGKGVGAYALSGIGVTLPLMNLIIAFCMLISIGGATISSIYMGQKDMERTTAVLHNVTILLILVGIAVAACTIPFLNEILLYFGASELTLPYAYDFMLIILLTNPIAYIFVGLNNVMRSTGYSLKAMYSALLSVIVNVILAPIFIFTLDMGIKGAAWATVVGNVLAAAYYLLYFRKGTSMLSIDPKDFTVKEVRNYDYTKYAPSFCVTMCNASNGQKEELWTVGSIEAEQEQELAMHLRVSNYEEVDGEYVEVFQESATCPGVFTVSNGEESITFTLNFVYVKEEVPAE